jgi:hypothetical protein
MARAGLNIADDVRTAFSEASSKKLRSVNLLVDPIAETVELAGTTPAGAPTAAVPDGRCVA